MLRVVGKGLRFSFDCAGASEAPHARNMRTLDIDCSVPHPSLNHFPNILNPLTPAILRPHLRGDSGARSLQPEFRI